MVDIYVVRWQSHNSEIVHRKIYKTENGARDYATRQYREHKGCLLTITRISPTNERTILNTDNERRLGEAKPTRREVFNSWKRRYR